MSATAPTETIEWTYKELEGWAVLNHTARAAVGKRVVEGKA
jgi:hypothetical protein